MAVGIEKGLIKYSDVTGLYKTTRSGVFYFRRYDQMVSMLLSVPEILDLESGEKNNWITERRNSDT
jgi:hypothetical protein